MTPNQAKHLHALIADQVEAERRHAVLQALNDVGRDEAHDKRTIAARLVVEAIDKRTKQRVIEYIDLLTESYPL